MGYLHIEGGWKLTTMREKVNRGREGFLAVSG